MMDTYLTGVHTSVWGDPGGVSFWGRFQSVQTWFQKKLGWCVKDKRVGGLMRRISRNAKVGSFVVSVFSFYGDCWSISSFIWLIKKEIQLLYCCNMLWHMNRMRHRSSHVTVGHVFVVIVCGYIAAVFSRSDHLKKWKWIWFLSLSNCTHAHWSIRSVPYCISLLLCLISLKTVFLMGTVNFEYKIVLIFL